MPLPEFRSIGWGWRAWTNAGFNPGAVERHLARAASELDAASEVESLRPHARELAEVMQAAARLFVALIVGDFERSRTLARGFPRSQHTGDFVATAALCEVLLGRAEKALTTVSELDAYDLPFHDGLDASALAHLALGDVATATEDIRRLAVRAAAGRFSCESNDAMLMLAALAHREGDDELARSLMRVMGRGRSPGTIGVALHFARQLGVFDEYVADGAALDRPGHPRGPLGALRSLQALRAEITRRGWD